MMTLKANQRNMQDIFLSGLNVGGHVMFLIDGYLAESFFFKLTPLIVTTFLFDGYLMISR